MPEIFFDITDVLILKITKEKKQEQQFLGDY